MSHYSMPYLPTTANMQPVRELSLAMATARRLASIIKASNKTK